MIARALFFVGKLYVAGLIFCVVAGVVLGVAKGLETLP